ncbi:hypothetical protein, partial [Actinophytocola sp.]|uniref:hypothetical protein n=1 Tax=Actinophytocola sp. TaxID=1872138 RepID=UPI003D6B1111
REDRPTAARARAMLARVVSGEPVDPWRPPVPRRQARHAVLTGATAVAVLLGLVVWSPWRTAADAPADVPVDGPQGTVLGDPRTADPCTLLEPETFERFGPAVEDPAYGNFNRCDVLIELGEDAEGEDIEVDVALELLDKADPDERPAPGATVEVEPAESDDEGGCDVSITLADLNRIDVNARPHGDVRLDVCEVAQVAGDRAVELLPAGELKRREPFDADSLARVDACTLLDRAALRAIPGLDPEPSADFGRWICEWSGRAATMDATVFFNQNTPLTAEDGEYVELAGHDVFLEPDEDGEECRAHVVHRTVRLDNGEDIDEIASLAIAGEAPTGRLCSIARNMARSVATNLPPTT